METAASHDWDEIWSGAHLATMVPGGDPYGTILDGAIALRGERIAWVGPAAEAVRHGAAHGIRVRDATGFWITPGLIDCHTHIVYGGNRVAEFEQRLNGASYAEIARAGGGIQSTVRATREADCAALQTAASVRVRRLMAEGVTTLEIKSGYGLDLPTERRLLQVARALGAGLPISVTTTYLGLHALPVEYAQRRGAFVERVSDDWLPTLAAEGLIDAVDAFCESIAFTPDESRRFLQAAARLGLPGHVHAGQLSDLGAAQLAAECGALSADHLEFLSAEGAAALRDADTVAVLLPGAFYLLRQTSPPPVQMLRQMGVSMAVATDCNPGTSPCTSLLLAMNMACTLFGLLPHEALAGTTRVAARALGLGADRGTLEAGRRADFVLWRIDRPAELAYGLGANPCAAVVHGGRVRPEPVIGVTPPSVAAGAATGPA